MSFQWVGSSRISTQQGSLRDYWVKRSTHWKKTGCQAFFNTLSDAEVASYGEQSDLLELQLTSQPCDTHQGFVRSQNSWCRDSRTSGELLLPVSRGPSHREITSQRNNEAPSRIPTRASPWCFTWQTLALLLCYWILTHTMPWHGSSTLHCLSSVRVTRPTTSAKNYQRSFTSWVHVRSC